ncbi:MAG: A/G-specific adenine glycosylase [Pseudomonadota bacterium]
MPATPVADDAPRGRAGAPDPAVLLAWYDRHARRMPWRTGPAERRAGVRPDPYRVWLSEVMLQQTTVATVTPRFERFVERWPTVAALAAARREDVLAEWAGLGYYARARNLHACAQAVARDHAGRFPDSEDALRGLPGVGAYTAAAVAAIAFDRPAAVVDGNVERVMARLFAETAPMPGVKERLRGHAARLTPAHRPGDYAPAVMYLGATICTPRRPACALCPWQAPCRGRAAGIAETLPAKAPKKAKPTRHGIVYALFDRRGRVGTLIRPERGLLAGMRALPTGAWVEGPAADDEPEGLPRPLAATGWRDAGTVDHVFTHFRLLLRVRIAETAEAPGAMPADRALAAMPTVFAKALRKALDARRSVAR